MTGDRTSEHERKAWNAARWTAGDVRGHYESWFSRANHPERPLAFWIRYTIFSPKSRPGDALGELWAIAFDGEKKRVIAVKEEHSIRACTFSKTELSARIADATHDHESLDGSAACAGHRIAWSLRFTSPDRPLLLLARPLYDAPFPKAKAVVGSPHAVFSGTFRVDDEDWSIDGWTGSQNHNWGERHTTRYAWGQVAGFDDAPDAFLEVITAQVKLGPWTTPRMTPLVLRLGDEELAFNTLGRALRADGRYDLFQWHFETGDDRAHVSGTIAAAASDFVGLTYYDPPGGSRTCLNSKIARCDVTVRRPGKAPLSLSTRSRAAFEILTTATDHGIRILDPKA
ncbi:MAG TPA: hypothetical protein VL400_22220 [Polyangiaceae bacterium]|jgi:hypothetical protein|nr:hypothetical protein [Polyangiaceae bacterium]